MFFTQLKIKRREFLARLVAWIGAGCVSRILPQTTANCYAAVSKPPSNKLVTVFHPGATDGSNGKNNANLVDETIIQMVDQGIKAFTGKNSLKDAWAEIIPDPTKKVAIKINCQIKGIYTKAKVVAPIIQGLILRGVSPDNIIVYDLKDTAFSIAGFIKNLGPGPKIGTVENFGGYSRFFADRLANLLIGGYPNSALNLLHQSIQNSQSKIINKIGSSLMPSDSQKYDCEYIINVPVLKALDGYSGVTLSMKNHYGSIGNPHDHHNDIMDYIPYINNLAPIRDKTRLIVMDAIFCQYKWTGGISQDNITTRNQILISNDPVAIDFLGWQIIEKERKKQGLPPVSPIPAYIAKASVLGLGTNNPEQVQYVKKTIRT